MALLPSAKLTLKLGQLVPKEAPRVLMEALQSVEVTHNDEGRSGFQLVFRAGRAAVDRTDDPVVTADELTPYSRVRILVTLAGTPHILMDGVITHQQFAPAMQPGASTFTVTGEDVSVMMDQIEFQAEFPAMSAAVRVGLILAKYSIYGLIPMIVPLPWDVPDLPTERVPTQQGTDLAYVSKLAKDHGLVFYVIPGPVEGTNIAYFGLAIRAGVPQRALTWNMGAATNLQSISFEHDATAPHLVASWFPEKPIPLPILTAVATRQPLSARPTLTTYAPYMKTTLGPTTEKSYGVAWAKALEETNTSTDSVVTASGELDVFRYGTVLQARTLVDLRGVGQTYDGSWYVKSVTHSLKKGEYRQKFSLERDGLRAIFSKVQL